MDDGKRAGSSLTRRDNLKISLVPAMKQKNEKVILQFQPDAEDRVKLYGESVELTE